MKAETGIQKLKLLKQDSILDHWSQLNEQQREALLKQVELIDPETFKLQQQLIPETPVHPSFTPFTKYEMCGNIVDKELGKSLIDSGKVACIIVAGGQGTRLGFDGPKGTFVIPGIEKTLFQLHAKKIRGPAAIMTSPSNDHSTKQYWKENNFFRLKEIEFFQQAQLPILNDEGNLFLENQGLIAFGPDGNGSVYLNLFESGILPKWQKRGIEIIQIIIVDNALANPFDDELIGYHVRKKAEITLKSTMRRDAEEKVGVLVASENRVKVLEYSELGDNREGDFASNLSYMCLDINFFSKIASKQLPLHKAHKKVPFWDSKAHKQSLPQSPNGWKFEKFLFDVIPYATAVEALIFPREECFAPLKNATGPDSPHTVSEALQKELKRLS